MLEAVHHYLGRVINVNPSLLNQAAPKAGNKRSAEESGSDSDSDEVSLSLPGFLQVSMQDHF